jgi:hypothetical protein
MKVTLEKADLLSILSTALGYPIADEDLEVQAEPFEVRIRRVNVEELAQQQQKTQNVDPDDLPEADPPEADRVVKNPVMTMAQILSKNERLSGTSAPASLGGPVASRPLGPEESEEPPPISEAELMAWGRQHE